MLKTRGPSDQGRAGTAPGMHIPQAYTVLLWSDPPQCWSVGWAPQDQREEHGTSFHSSWLRSPWGREKEMVECGTDLKQMMNFDNPSQQK